ncbi:MAG: outer membrane protein assembly factor BamB family protein, partial [Planctomycetota bacterium]
AVIWRIRQTSTDWKALFNRLDRLDPPTREAVYLGVWRRARPLPRSRELFGGRLYAHLARACPEAVLADARPITTKAEAVALIRAAIGEPPARGRAAAARVSAYLRCSADPHPHVRMGLAKLYCRMGKPELAEKCLVQALPGRDAVKTASLWCALGEARLARVDGMGARKAFRAAIDSIGPKGYCMTFSDGSLSAYHVRMKLATAVSMMPLAGLSVGRHWMDAVPKTNGYAETAGERCFYLGDRGTLRSWDPFAGREEMSFAMPDVVRDFMPLDADRVFAAFQDGTAALYQRGRDGPVWRRELSLGFDSFLSASPRTVTACSEKGVLHVLNPTTGATMWTRNVRSKPWPRRWWRSRRGLAAQNARGVLVGDRADRPTALEWVELSTGRSRWTWRPDFRVGAVTLGEKRLIAAGRKGRVAAVSLATGQVVWRKHLAGKAAYAVRDLRLLADPASRRVYVALRETVVAMADGSGEVLWQWKWRPPPGAGTAAPEPLGPTLRTVGNCLCLVMNWRRADVDERRERTDVICLSPAGAVILHRTTPVYTSNWARAVVRTGSKLAFLKGMQWEVWDLAARDIQRVDKDARAAALTRIRHPGGLTDAHRRRCRALIAQLEDPAYALRQAAVDELAANIALYRPVMEKMSTDASLSSNARLALKDIMARHGDHDAAERVGAALVTDVGYLIRLLARASELDRRLIVSALQRRSGAERSADEWAV